jgi:hypothetical protein
MKTIEFFKVGKEYQGILWVNGEVKDIIQNKKLQKAVNYLLGDFPVGKYSLFKAEVAAIENGEKVSIEV